MKTFDGEKSGRPLFIFFVCFAALILFISVFALRALNNGKTVANGGNISLSQVSIDWAQDALILDAMANIELPARMQAGLDNGVPLTFIMDVKLLRTRTMWFDRIVASFQKSYTLTYYDLTRHYRVHAVQSNASQNFRSLSSALTGLGSFDDVSFDLSVGHDLLLMNKADLIGSIRVRLDTAALPLPLQPLIRSNWKLTSEEIRWPVI